MHDSEPPRTETPVDVARIYAEFVHGLTFEKLPSAVVETTKTLILDQIGVMLLGSAAAGVGELLATVRDWGGKPESSVLVHGAGAVTIAHMMPPAIRDPVVRSPTSPSSCASCTERRGAGAQGGHDLIFAADRRHMQAPCARPRAGSLALPLVLRTPMFEYFPNNYPWSLAVMSALNRGGQISEIDEACRPLKEVAGRKNDPVAQIAWFESWMKLAERVERLGLIDEQANHPLSAGRKLMRAGLYYLLAERMPSHKDPRRMIAYKRGVATYAKGLKLRREPVERVEIPYGEHTLPAFFMKAPVPGRAPCIVHFDGFDVTKEIIYASVGEEYRRRGISLLIVDHPGVGEALRLQNLPSIPETEKPAAAAVDYLETRDDVDKDRIGMVALSLGGYYAPRAAAFEKRFKCCVAWGAIYDFGAAFAARINGTNEPSVPGFAEHAQWVFGKKTLEEAMAVTRQMTLEKVAANITCPLLIVHGENDRQIPLWHAEKTYEAAVNSPGRELKIFSLADGGAEHCGADNNSLIVDYITDWVAEKLGASVAGV